MAEDSITELSRFKGCLVGAVCGDCIGAKFERLWHPVAVEKLVEYAKDIDQKVADCKAGEPPVDDKGKPLPKGFIMHTDDACMTLDLAKSLIKRKGFDAKHLAKYFAKTYEASPRMRNYGPHVRDVLETLAKKKNDPFGPAQKQFGGSGSFGNGSAMRVSPVTLFHHGNAEKIVELAKSQSKITHTHPYGLDGAILQALAIEKAFTPGPIDLKKFTSELLADLQRFTVNKDTVTKYEEKMAKVDELLALDHLVEPKEFELAIGSNVTAQQAVPATIFCFLNTLDKERIPGLTEYNGFERAIMYSAALCCDSDTVACMAGAIAGAYYGFEAVPANWMIACEEAESAARLAEQLYEINKKQNSKK